MPSVRIKRVVDKVPIIAGTACTLLGLIVLLGWHSRTPVLIQVLPQLVPMQYNTALGFVFAGLGLVLMDLGTARATAMFSALVVLGGALSGIQYLAGTDFGIDQLFFDHYITTETSHPGRMAPNTALSFALSGAGLLAAALMKESVNRCWVAGVVGSVVLGLGLVAIAGYAAGLSPAYGWGVLSRMAVHTAFGFSLLGTGLISVAWRGALAEGSPDEASTAWWPASAAVFVISFAALLGDAMESHEYALIGQGSVPTSTFAPTVAMVFGVIMGILVGTTLWQNRRSKLRAVAAEQLVERLALEEAAEETTEARHARVIRGAIDGVWDWNIKTGEKYFSPRWLEILGYQPDELEPVQATFDQLVHPDDKARVWSEVEAHLEKKAPYDVEFRLRHKSGNYIWLQSRGRAVWDERGKPLYMAGSIVDISARKHAEEELSQYAHIVWSAGDMLALVDRRYVYLAVNAAYLKMQGKTEDQMIGRTVTEVFGDEFFNNSVKPRAERCLAGEYLRYQDWFEFDEAGLKYMDVSYSPYYGPGAKIEGFVVSARNITEQKRAEEALQQSEAKYRTFVETANEGFWRIDEDMRIIEVNDAVCRMIGYKREEILGKRPFDFSNDTDAPTLKTEIEESLGQRLGPSNWEGRFVRKDGSPLDVDVSATDFADPEGNPAGRFAFFSDVTHRKQAEEKLRNSEAKYRTFVDTTNEGFWRIDEEMRIIEVNNAICQMLGYSREEILGKRPFDFADEADFAEYEGVIKRTLEGRVGPREWQGRFRRKDGTMLEVHNSGTDFIDQDGKSSGRFAFISDITDRNRDARELAKITAQFQSAFQHAIHGMALHSIEGKYLQANEALCRTLGYAEDELLKLDFRKITLPDDLPKDTEMAERFLSGEIAAAQWDKRYIHKDGHVIPVQIGVSLVRDSEGEPTFYVAQVQDLTALKESEDRFRKVFDAIEAGTMVINTDGRIEIFNPAAEEMFGYRSDEVLGKNIMMLMPEPIRGQHDSYIKDYLETGEAKVVGVGRQVTGLRKGGDEFPMQLEVGEMEINGRIWFVGSVADLTDFQSLENQLRQAQKLEAVGQLTGGLAHDFNNLLAVIHGNLCLLAEDLAAGELVAKDESVELVQAALGASKRGADLTQHLLAFSRKQALQPKVLDLNRVILGMEPMLRRTLGEAVMIEVHLKDSKWKAIIDPSQLESALLNLALNARDAMPDGGLLSIRTTDIRVEEADMSAHPGAVVGDYILLTIKDTGVGMAPVVIEKAFDPFFTTKGVGKGSGLGLSMVHGFVKQSGGYVAIESEPGESTMVKLYLPRSEQQNDFVDASRSSTAIGGNESILLVEDDEDMRRIAVRILKRLGYVVFEADNGAAALRLLKEEGPFDLLLSDVILPNGMNGPRVAQEAQKIVPGLKVLFMSGYTENAVVHQGSMDKGAQLIDKPFSPVDLAKKIREVLQTDP